MRGHWFLQIIPVVIVGIGMSVTGFSGWFWAGLAILLAIIGLAVLGRWIYGKQASSEERTLGSYHHSDSSD